MPATEAVPAFALFVTIVLAAALQGLAASGHFPSQNRARPLQSSAGTVLLYATIAMTAAALAGGVAAAWYAIPWPAVIIGSGAMLLVAPMILRLLPDAFVDGWGALLGFAGAAVVFTLLLIWITFAGTN